MDQTDFPGDTIGYINFAPFLIGTPVIDAYQLKLPVPGVHYADEGAKRQVGVCRGQGFGVEALTIGGLTPVEPGAIPTGIAPGSTGGKPPMVSASTPKRAEEHTSELQSQSNLICRLLLEKK